MITGFLLQGIAQTVVINPASPWTVPTGVTAIKVEVWGGGGGGGSANGAFLTTYGAGGGGGGAYQVATFAVTPGQTYSVVIGAGGTAGSSSAGGTGGISTVTGITGVGTVSANGGGGGGRGNGGNGAAGSAGTGGFNNGGAGGASSGNGAGGGGGAGNSTPTGTGNGGAGSNTAAGAAGLGSPNTAPYAGGIGAAARTTSGTGITATAVGGGGGGGRANGISGNSYYGGGSGAAGQVVITYTVCTPPAVPAVASPVNYCQNATASPLTATGTGLLWYTVSSGGTGSSTAPTPLTTSAGTTSYYVSQTIGCEGSRAQIDVIVHASPSAMAVKTDISCFNTSNGQIKVTGSEGLAPYTYSIYNGDPASSYQSGDTFNGLAPGQYKIRVKDSNGCESPAIPQ